MTIFGLARIANHVYYLFNRELGRNNALLPRISTAKTVVLQRIVVSVYSERTSEMAYVLYKFLDIGKTILPMLLLATVN